MEITGITPRQYQHDAHTWATNRDNAVVCLPTGTGKTLVGCMWACTRLRDSVVNRILILEPSRFLVEQTHAYYTEYTTLQTTKLDGTVSPTNRGGLWQDGDIVVTTPQTAVNDLAHLNFDAVIIDECHHTTGQHAFAQLLEATTFIYKLGLSATVSADKEHEITTAIGPIYRQSWTDLPDEHVPDWIGEIYDTPYPSKYSDVVDALESKRRDLAGTRLVGLPTLGLRMLCRDGVLALEETLRRDTEMGDILGDEILPILDGCPELHKLNVCRDVLADHDFDKAVLFVDRVTVAEKIADELSEYTTALLLGRVHTSRDTQEAAVGKAKADDTDLIVATAAGEEGIDLPAADLLVVWSSVVSSVRFIQRLGRIMRPDGSNGPRVAVYLATPDSPDYDALRRGIEAASRAGLDIANIDEESLLADTVAGRVQHVLDGIPRQLDVITECLNSPDETVERWLRTTVRDGDVFYLYSVPEHLSKWREAAGGWVAAFGAGSEDGGESVDASQLGEALRNNFSPRKSDRYYLREADIDLLPTEFPALLRGDRKHRLEVTFGPSHQNRGAHEASGTAFAVFDVMNDELADAETFYATVSSQSSNPSMSVQMTYHGSATDPVVETVIQNADAVVTQIRTRIQK